MDHHDKYGRHIESTSAVGLDYFNQGMDRRWLTKVLNVFRRNRIAIIIISLTVLLILNYVTHSSRAPDRPAEKLQAKLKTPDLPLPEPVSDKWIVVTSIRYPSEDVKSLASLDGWNLVVVADVKTPKDWHLHAPRVHFLSLDMQKKMGFRITTLLPENSYTRKNVGYLYAIQKGAKWIYDTDDDNKPFGRGLYQFDFTERISTLCFSRDRSATATNISSNLFNPYRFFGHPVMWPRGFPLEHLKDHSNGKGRVRLCRSIRTPATQQGLVHKDPDVDAIYRLMYADKKTGLNESFSKLAPPIVLSAGTYSPWNSQNTLFHRSAFFTLFLPVSVAFRVTDIWRSYFSQRLLHLIGERIAFYPANAIQNRNAHDYLSDFKQEKQLYESSGRLVEYLDSWRCFSSDIAECAIKLAESLAQLRNPFWKLQDGQMVKLWIDDLRAIGYEFPAMIRDANRDECDKATLVSNRVHFEEIISSPANHGDPALIRAELKLKHMEKLYDWCRASNATADFFRSVSHQRLAVLHSKSKSLSSALGKVLILLVDGKSAINFSVFQNIYQPYFATIFFCGRHDFWNNSHEDDLNVPFNYVSITAEQAADGYLVTQCLFSVSRMRLQNVEGYYVVSTAIVLKFWKLDEHIAYGFIEDRESSNSKWSERDGQHAAKVAYKLITRNLNSMEYKTWLQYQKGLKDSKNLEYASLHLQTYTGHAERNLLYIPPATFEYFSGLMRVFRRSGLGEGFAIAKFLQTTSTGNLSSTAMRSEIYSKVDNPFDQKRFCDSVVMPFKKELIDMVKAAE
nr:Protein of unknown function DUF288 domain containing protein [Haemonchus contortus]